MSKEIITLEKVAALVAIVCPNEHGIHAETYIRYLILIDQHGHAIWLDSPSTEDCTRIYEHCVNATPRVIQAPCVWCTAKTKNS